MLEGISPEAIEAALAHASTEEKRKLNAILSELDKRENRKKCQDDFLAFVKTIWPDFIEGPHHRRIAKLFEAVARGEKKRIIINLAPRHTKSEFASFLLPAWFLGKFPKKKILQVSNTAELAEGFGRKVRNLLDTDDYRDIYPDVTLRSDSKAAGRWNTNHGGDYYSTGVGAALAGRGADLCLAENTIILIDDGNIGKEIEIKDAQVGDKIATISGWEKVTKKKLTIHQRSVKINEEVIASFEHPFMTQRGWVEAKDLVVGDTILTRSIWNRIKQLAFALLRHPRGKLGKV
jgi:hypothetical protein